MATETPAAPAVPFRAPSGGGEFVLDPKTGIPVPATPAKKEGAK